LGLIAWSHSIQIVMKERLKAPHLLASPKHSITSLALRPHLWKVKSSSAKTSSLSDFDAVKISPTEPCGGSFRIPDADEEPSGRKETIIWLAAPAELSAVRTKSCAGKAGADPEAVGWRVAESLISDSEILKSGSIYFDGRSFTW
jgi:hypothetical protein